MKLVSMKEILLQAKQGSYAVGQFNLNTLLWAVPILEAAQEESAPVIIASSDRLVDKLGGCKTIVATVKNLIEKLSISVPVVLHLDHATNVDRCKQAIDAGFTSVMIDGSSYPIKKNISLTKKVTEYARHYEVSVEAEVGTVGGSEDGIKGVVKYADIDECVQLVEETNVDALAAALGSVHGPYQGKPKLGFKEMEEISKRIDIPLVLHGGSGIPLNQIKKAINLGHSKINVNTECAQAWTNSIRSFLSNEENMNIYEPQLFLESAYEDVKKVVKEKIKDFGSTGKAKILST